MTTAIHEYSGCAEWSQNNKLQVHAWSINITLALSLISSHLDDRKGEGFEALGYQFCPHMFICSRRIILYHCHVSFKSFICLFININQLDALNFIISLFQASTCFEHVCSSSGGQIVLYSLWYHHTYRWPSGAQIERGLNLCTVRPPIGVMIPETV
jgi:alpha-amylase/alpha-mannosidase (GH57 family)